MGIWESSYHQETPHGAWLQGGAGELYLDATDHLDIFLQVDEAVAVLQAHHAKTEADLQQVLPQGLLPLSWGCGQEPRHAGSGPKHLHMSLLGRRVLGNLRLSHTF